MMDGANVTSVDCHDFADRCMTFPMTIGHNTMVMKTCSFNGDVSRLNEFSDQNSQILQTKTVGLKPIPFGMTKTCIVY